MTNEEKAKLLVLNMKRCIELLEVIVNTTSKQPNFSMRYNEGNAELKAKMHEVRRDSLYFQKIMYPDFSHIRK